MRVAVTGATGFVGRHIVERLVECGHACRCWYRPTSDRGGFEQLGDHLEWVPGELGDKTACRNLLAGCEAVIHAALYHPGGGFRGGEGELIEFVQKNVLGTLELIETARAIGVGRFVFISTCAVHEKVLDDCPLDETPTLLTGGQLRQEFDVRPGHVHPVRLGAGMEARQFILAVLVRDRAGMPKDRTQGVPAGSLWPKAARRQYRLSRSPPATASRNVRAIAHSPECRQLTHWQCRQTAVREVIACRRSRVREANPAQRPGVARSGRVAGRASGSGVPGGRPLPRGFGARTWPLHPTHVCGRLVLCQP